MGRFFALATFIVGGLIVADLWAHGDVTKKIIGAGVSESRLLAGKG